MDIADLYSIYRSYPSISIDSRKVQAGDIFFALRGPSFNGNEYIAQALEAGAAYCVTDDPSVPESAQVLRVDDSLTALQQLARKHRRQFDIPFLAITGSNGKTTTKELIHAVLSSQFITYTTEGNLNNHIGVPLTILKVKHDAEFAVIEMGANHIGEIASYCAYAMPTHALITNCGKAHLEGFGSEEGVRIGKGELFDFIRRENGAAFVFTDFDYLNSMSDGIRHIIRYGTDPANSDYSGDVSSQSGLLNIKMYSGVEFEECTTQLVGGYNLPNVLAAIAVGKTFNVPEDKIVSALQNYIPTNSRSQLIEKDGNKIILDAYNANPSSMKVAIENFAQMEGNHKVVILGAMRELGASSVNEHKAIVDIIRQNKWAMVVLVGDDFKSVAGDYLHFNSVEEARNWFTGEKMNDAQILIKGSRGLQMEKLLR